LPESHIARNAENRTGNLKRRLKKILEVSDSPEYPCVTIWLQSVIDLLTTNYLSLLHFSVEVAIVLTFSEALMN
jgi:hypothetical protein